MKKTILIIICSLFVGALLSPFIGMAMGGTRSFILGLAPDESILSLASEIDSSKEEMQAKIDEQNQIIQAKTEELETLKSETLSKEEAEEATNIAVAEKMKETENQKANQEACFKAQELYSTIPQPKSGENECHVLGPANIVDQVKKTREQMKGSKSSECHKNYYEKRLKPIYEEYLKYKELCGS